jgi:cytochrome c-type biogenesis protein CcmH/NrfF
LILQALKCSFAAAWIAILLAIPMGTALGLPAKTSVQEVSEGLTCQCGCGLTVANCNHPQCEFSVPVRGQIEAMIRQGMRRTQIIRSFQTKYGEKILSAPTTEGFNLVAWLMPCMVVFAGCFIIVGAIHRWRSQSAPSGRAIDELPDSDELRQRLEQEIREHA